MTARLRALRLLTPAVLAAATMLTAAAPVQAVTPQAAASAAVQAAAVQAAAVPTSTWKFGTSVRGRALTVTRVGSPTARVRVLVLGCLHGNECAGVPVVDRLRRTVPRKDVALYLVNYANPDGTAARTRQNARGVDLNRNFPGMRPSGRPGDVYYPGPKALSEPESYALYVLMWQLSPNAIVSYHQHMNLIDYGGGNRTLAAAYAAQTGMRFTQLTRYPGSSATWAHAAYPHATILTVELPAGSMSSTAVSRHANAVASLAARL